MSYDFEEVLDWMVSMWLGIMLFLTAPVWVFPYLAYIKWRDR